MPAHRLAPPRPTGESRYPGVASARRTADLIQSRSRQRRSSPLGSASRLALRIATSARTPPRPSLGRDDEGIIGACLAPPARRVKNVSRETSLADAEIGEDDIEQVLDIDAAGKPSSCDENCQPG